MHDNDLMAVARALVAPGKGILAADESFGTIEKRFKDRGTIDKDGNYTPFNYNAKGDPVEESMLLESYVAISEECRRTSEQVSIFMRRFSRSSELFTAR